MIKKDVITKERDDQEEKGSIKRGEITRKATLRKSK